MNLARSHYQRTLARQAAKAAAGDPLPSVAAEGARADGLGGIIRPDAATNASGLMLVKLTSDRSRLKEIQSVERKIDAKREMLPEYQAWLDGLIEGAANLPEGVQNDVLTTCMMWHIDTGDFTRALELAAIVLDRDIPLPSQFNRKAPTAIAEEIAEAAFASIRNATEFDVDHIAEVQLLTDDKDMPDEVRAKLHKATALIFERKADALSDAGGEGADGAAGAYSAALDAAQTAATRALELDSSCGVKGLLAKIARAQKKIEAERKAASA